MKPTSRTGVAIIARAAPSRELTGGAPERTVATADAAPGASDSLVAEASQRHLMGRASSIGLLMRHCINGGVALIAVLAPDPGLRPSGLGVLICLICWSLYRLATHSTRLALVVTDLGVTVAVCLATPLLTADPHVYLSNSTVQAIAGTAVIAFAVSLPIRLSAAMTVAIALAYAWGLSSIIGWDRVGSVLAIYYFALQWATSALIRYMLLRVAAAVDRAREGRESAEATREVDAAVRTFEREQLALLHDTAASTLLMVGQGAEVPPGRLAAQARRDLALLRSGPWQPIAQRVDLVAAMGDVLVHARTPVQFDGDGPLWVDGDVGQAVIASSREALNNVDRHAGATTVRVCVALDRVVISDDGVGFDANAVRGGHGIAQSMTSRMQRVGGVAAVMSAPGTGTRVELCWPTDTTEPAGTAPIDPDRLIERVRLIYASAIAVYAVANLAATVPYAVAHAGWPVAQTALAVVAGLCPVLAVLRLRGLASIPVGGCLTLALGVVVLTPMLLKPDELGSQADWVQAGIGWCVLPLLLTMPVHRAAAILVGYWLVGAVLELVLHPTSAAWVNVGLGTGSILGVQLFALAFDGLVRDAAANVHADVQARKSLVIGSRVARAVAEDYHRRYASLVDDVVPLLEALSVAGAVDAGLRRRARAESRQLRALFDHGRTFDHPLMRHIRPTVDAAEARSVEVVVDVSGRLPTLAERDAARLLAPLHRTLQAPMTSAHVVLNSAPRALSLSVVCRGVSDPDELMTALGGLGVVDVTVADDTVWMIVEHAPEGGTETGD